MNQHEFAPMPIFQLLNPGETCNKYNVTLARDGEDMRACEHFYRKTLRNLGPKEQVSNGLHSSIGGRFGEYGAIANRDNTDTHENAYDNTRDMDCHHLMVKLLKTDRIIAAASLLTRSNLSQGVRFATESKFDLHRIYALPGRIMEIRRTCIDTDYLNAQVVSTLWKGLASIIVMHRVDYIVASVAVSSTDGGRYAQSLMKHLKQKRLTPDYMRVIPKTPFPRKRLPSTIQVVLPSVLKTYMRYGALVCGAPNWDAENQVAEFLLLLDRNRINKRMSRPLNEHI
jgi:putative hemolysin